MNAMIDAQCPKCNRRFGWQGDLTDRPACPRCGHRPDADSLAAEQARMDEDQRLCDLHPGKAKADELRSQRLLAGLTLHQAASQAGIPAKTISDCENGRATLTAPEARELAKAYGCGDGLDG